MTMAEADKYYAAGEARSARIAEILASVSRRKVVTLCGHLESIVPVLFGETRIRSLGT